MFVCVLNWVTSVGLILMCLTLCFSGWPVFRSVFLCVPYTECQCWSVLLCV